MKPGSGRQAARQLSFALWKRWRGPNSVTASKRLGLRRSCTATSRTLPGTVDCKDLYGLRLSPEKSVGNGFSRKMKGLEQGRSKQRRWARLSLSWRRRPWRRELHKTRSRSIATPDQIRSPESLIGPARVEQNLAPAPARKPPPQIRYNPRKPRGESPSTPRPKKRASWTRSNRCSPAPRWTATPVSSTSCA